ncbi:uncharacterized protein LOC121377585 isoform X3 [Gigantopelta aegis]|uniref:uncharacterized protein LOC121377585 isoform X2 n=1 Tax=Gigantopelta aegis TaxID=1735272 RepID=UPI001B88792D|nr:uncharacterized protein LOC121377585 isoform X2 [Gigantopelta aegis]XP_041361578.1 uncharacterized protein LOC121377585 isoform X3 [Gigantopelta aegis]
MKKIILASMILVYMATTVNCECDIKKAESCKHRLMLLQGEPNMMQLCIGHLKFVACLTSADCAMDPIYGPLKLEGIQTMNDVCNSDGTKTTASILALLIVFLAQFFM